MKKPKSVKRRRYLGTDDNSIAKLIWGEQELRRWAIEMAMAWPTQAYSYTGGMQWSGQMQYVDADVIGRAEKLLEWVRKNG